MKLENLEARIKEKSFSEEEAKKELIKLLKAAHAGERAAAYAYWGHANSLFVRFNAKEKEEILEIYKDEIHHKEGLKKMLDELQAKPAFLLERLMQLIGSVIAFLCLWGGWFIPMYGAGKLENKNIEEYEVAARLAYLSGDKKYIEDLLIYAEKEWDHELYFRQKSESHFLYRWFPKWIFPEARNSIRENFENFKSDQESL